MLDYWEPVTGDFARIFGVYMVAAGVGLFLGRERWDGVIEAFRTQPALLYIGAVMAFAAGAVTVTLHNYWDSATAIIVSVIGWAALVEGVIMLAYPEPLLRLGEAMLKSKAVMMVFPVITIALGVFLLAAVYF